MHLLLQADARRIPLADRSVDAIVTDPPYAQTNESYDSNVACNPEVWRECFRVAKPNSALVSFAGSPTYHRIASAIEAGGWRVRQMWGWVYRDGMITSAWPNEGFDRLAPAMDPICYATKGKLLLELEREGGREWMRDQMTRGEPSYSDRTSSHGLDRAIGRWPRSVISSWGVEGFQYFALSRTNGGRTGDIGHPNEKPLSIMEWIVSKVPGRVILDPFAGSGTTLAAAESLGRRGIGLDLSRDYLGLAARRIGRPHARTPRPGREEHMPLFAGGD